MFEVIEHRPQVAKQRTPADDNPVDRMQQLADQFDASLAIVRDALERLDRTRKGFCRPIGK